MWKKSGTSMCRGDLMILGFYVSQLGSGQGLVYDIEKVKRVTQKNFKKLGNPGRAELNRFIVK